MILAMKEPQPIPSRKRFKTISEEEMAEIRVCRTSDSTKRNTKWGVKIFQDYQQKTGVKKTFPNIQRWTSELGSSAVVIGNQITFQFSMNKSKKRWKQSLAVKRTLLKPL
ncbi:hypothetical protein KUTeg_011284 [Tegillarca granosa]|uniref:Uncharacterized protein n=1 Tax=Tegillarca granosa TaxID=220873 RepID=A0ABQ9F192_TEGGR|nr:hypothetical protein KUTeg_011284 [Tegillarca granosa]